MDILKEMHSFLWMLVRSDVGLYKKKVVNGMLQSLLYTALSAYKSRNMYETVKRSRNEDIFFNFFTLLEHNFRQERSVQFYADKLCITPKHLSTVVKAVSGRTAGSWIDGYVILAAKVMLRSSANTIQEVSVALNFPNQSFFGKFFKQHVGISPREYRLKNDHETN
jgi:AraC-like DNA-binding protein